MTSPDVDNPESHKALQLGRSDWMWTPAAWTGSMKSDVGYCMFQTKLHCHVCSTGRVLTKTARHLWTQGTYWKCFWQDWIDQQTVSLTLLSKRQTTRQRARQRHCLDQVLNSGELYTITIWDRQLVSQVDYCFVTEVMPNKELFSLLWTFRLLSQTEPTRLQCSWIEKSDRMRRKEHSMQTQRSVKLAVFTKFALSKRFSSPSSWVAKSNKRN